jgi:hypothetical protein
LHPNFSRSGLFKKKTFPDPPHPSFFLLHPNRFNVATVARWCDRAGR